MIGENGTPETPDWRLLVVGADLAHFRDADADDTPEYALLPERFELGEN